MKNKVLLLAMLLAFSVGSCSKDGCTDATATNYEEKAKKDDGSCTYAYSGDISFWFNESRSSTLISSSVTSLTVYFDDVSVGTINPEEWAIGPECFGENRFTVSVELGNNFSKSINYVIRDQTGTGRFNGIVVVEANECVSKQLL